MNTMWVTVFLCVLITTLGIHLGLFEAVSGIAQKVLSCHKCSTFWLTAFALFMQHRDIITILALSIFASYISVWMYFLIVELQHLYSWLNEKQNKRKSQS